jgi:hypothetical protein
VKASVSSKNLVLLSRNPVPLFLCVSFQLIEIHIAGFFYLSVIPRSSAAWVRRSSLIKTLKVEEAYLNEYDTFEDAFRNVWHFIEKVNNQKRLHSAFDYRSPVQFEVEVALNTIA